MAVEKAGGNDTAEGREQAPLIMIVDDEPLALDMASMALERQGFSTIPVRGGKEALEKVGEQPPDLILLDIRMPDIDGFTLFQRIRSEKGLQALPAIFVTASSDIESKLTGLELGAVDYITKPYNPNELIARVRNTLRLQRLEREARDRLSEQVRRRTYETLLTTITHYINNAVASIDMGIEVTPVDEPETVRRFMDAVRRQSRVISATIRAIEEMKERLEQGTITYVEGKAWMLDIEDMIKQRVNEMRQRDEEDDGW
ncbi:MAG: Alkaline phosphatase synthesis transcriptional regulatory protein PhoP [Calditrichaeota bacterium]|nr:Alkaline phosphatase synthesis transcriptional regulatory protein PhoP [Calditrichota bacterium]